VEADNGFKVMHIVPGDPLDQEVVVALTVGVGSATDPYPISGLAHLAEHMVLTGSEKYPESNYLDKVVEKYNGVTNAVTREFSTTYYFKVHKSGFAEAMDVLYHNIKHPTLARANLDRELNNIRSELSMRRFSESNINYFLLRHISNIKDNSLFRDGFGDLLRTEAEDEKKKLLDRLKVFVEKNYVPNIMTLAVYGHLSQKEVETEIMEKFKTLSNSAIERPKALSNFVPFIGNTYNRIFTVKGSRGADKLYMNFVLPSYQQYYKELPLEYISFHINYYSYNSLRYNLIRQGLIHDLSDTLSAANYEYQVYTVRFSLTAKGRKNIELILKTVYSYLNKLRTDGVKKRTYNNLATISMIHFVYQSNNPNAPIRGLSADRLEFVKDASIQMLDVPIQQVLTGRRVFQKYDKPLIKGLLDQMKAEKTIFILKSKHFTIANRTTTFSVHNRTQIMNTTKGLFDLPQVKTDPKLNFDIPDNYTMTKKANLNHLYYRSSRINFENMRNLTEIHDELIKDISFPRIIRGIPTKFDLISYECNHLRNISEANLTKDTALPSKGQNSTKTKTDKKSEVKNIITNAAKGTVKQLARNPPSNSTAVRPPCPLIYAPTINNLTNSTSTPSQKTPSNANSPSAKRPFQSRSDPNLPNPTSGSTSHNPQQTSPHQPSHPSQKPVYPVDYYTHCPKAPEYPIRATNDPIAKKVRARSANGTSHINEPTLPRKKRTGTKRLTGHTKDVKDPDSVSLVGHNGSNFTATSVVKPGGYYYKVSPTPQYTEFEKCLSKEVQIDRTNYYPKTSLLHGPQGFEIYHKLFRLNLKPVTLIFIEFQNAEMNEELLNPKKRLHLEETQVNKLIAKEYFNQLIDLHLYDYQINNYNFGFYLTHYSTRIMLKGFSSNSEDYAKNVVSLISSRSFNLDIFNRAKQTVRQKFHTMSYASNIKQAMKNLGRVIDRFHFKVAPDEETKKRYIKLIDNADLVSFRIFIDKLLQESYIRYLYFGNIEETETMRLSLELTKSFRAESRKPIVAPDFQKVIRSLPRIVPIGHQMVRMKSENPSDTNHMYLSYFQFEFSSQRARIWTIIIAKMMNEETFRHIRVNLNLGYVANAIPQNHQKVTYRIN
jgi:secreted Zn-dependent insulinase-like peptidase